MQQKVAIYESPEAFQAAVSAEVRAGWAVELVTTFENRLVVVYIK